MRTLGLFTLLLTLPYAVEAISCLVMRPGYGLITESCPTTAVGCRIKARRNHVEWYEWSKLYDRNQLVCVYPGEYEGAAGCVKKPSGNIRCWCGGADDCNDPETSQQLVDAFQKSDKSMLDIVIRTLERGEKLQPTTSTTTTSITSTVRTPARTHATRPPPRRVSHKKVVVHKVTKTNPTTTTTTTTTAARITATTPSATRAIPNNIERQEYTLPTEMSFGKTFDETRRKLTEEMREEDERLQQLLADEEAEMSTDVEDSYEDREEQMRKERERNRWERKERARADERRRQTEEEALRTHERVQKHTERAQSTEDVDVRKTSSPIALSISLISSICSILLLLLLRDGY